jgi:hypothetical protein
MLLLLTPGFGHNFGVFSFFAHSASCSLVVSSLFTSIATIEVRSLSYFAHILIEAVFIDGSDISIFEIPFSFCR